VRRLAALAAKLDDWLNPIAVKELRQAVQAKYVAGLLLVFLIGQLIAVGAIVLGRRDYEPTYATGAGTFMVLFGILVGTCMLFVPAYCSGRLMAERSAANADLLFVTALRPRAIVWGKLSSGLVLTILIYSACMPFLTFTYLLRGIDLPSIFLSLLTGLFGSAAAIQLAIFIACIPTSRPLKGLLSLVALGFTIQLFVAVLLSSFMWMRGGVAGSASAAQLWTTVLLALALALGGIGFLFVLTVAMLSPASANRALPVRLYMSIAWLVTGGAAAATSAVRGDLGTVSAWVAVSVVLFCIGLFASVSERETLGPRVTRTIPRRAWLRPLAFLFYSGGAGGVTWACLMIVLTFVGAALSRSLRPSGYTFDELSDTMTAMAGIALYAFCYAGTAYLIRRAFFPKTKPAYTWMIGVCIAAAAFLLPVLGQLVRPGAMYYRRASELWSLGTPLLVSGYDYRALAFTFAGVWALVVALIASPLFFRQVAQFRPYKSTIALEPQAVPEG
jgi:hypothetical protein